MDEIDKRLSETSAACLKAYETWSKDKKDGKAREELQESVHELRKVASRVEIEVAISERNEMTQKPIPIPPHRDSNKRGRDNDDRGNRAGANEGSHQGKALGNGNGKPRARRTLTSKNETGGDN